MNQSSPSENWLQTVLQHLSSDGFSVSHNVKFASQEFMAVAHRSRLEVTKCGNCETFFIFGDFQTCATDSVARFSSLAFKYAKKTKSFPLPCGLFEAVVCFAVYLVDSLDESMPDFVRSEIPPKHYAAMEIPVVYDRSQGKLCFFEKTPLWGCLYYKGFRNQIGKYLAMDLCPKCRYDLQGLEVDGCPECGWGREVEG